MSENPKPETVLERIRRTSVKTGVKASRARASKPAHVSGVVIKSNVPEKVIKTLLAAITDNDIDRVARVWREATEATNRVYDIAEKRMVEIPDHATRIKAANMIAAYREGLPIARQIQLTGNIEDLGAVLGRMSESPEAQRMLQAIDVDSLPSGQNVASEDGATREEA